MIAAELATMVRPIQVRELFGDAADGGQSSDHTGYVVRYRIHWSPKFVHRPVAADRRDALGGTSVVRASWNQGPEE